MATILPLALLVVVTFLHTGVGRMRYDLIRLILLPRQADMFGREMPTLSPIPFRQWWIQTVFSEEITFQHYGSEFHYVPTPLSDAGGLLVGRIGRPFLQTENLPPDAGLGEVEHEGWKASAVIIDPSSHDDGQKAAMQVDGRVGKAASIFKSLAAAINARVPSEPFVLETNPVVDPATFWVFEEENRDQITSISFELIAPNMFGTRHDLDEEMKALRDNEHVRKAKLELENSDGLKLNTPRVRESVAYALEGGGNLKARTKRRKTFNSKRKTKRVIIADPPEEIVQESFSTRVMRAIRGIFFG